MFIKTKSVYINADLIVMFSIEGKEPTVEIVAHTLKGDIVLGTINNREDAERVLDMIIQRAFPLAVVDSDSIVEPYRKFTKEELLDMSLEEINEIIKRRKSLKGDE